MAHRLLCLLLATTEAMKTKKTVSKPTSWTYLERFCFSETPEGQEEKAGDPPVLELHANFELKVKHRGGSLLMYFSEGADSFPSIANKTFTELSLEERYAKATVAYDFLMVDGQETTSTKKSYLISRSPRFVYLVWSNYNIRCNEKCTTDFQNGTLSTDQQAQLVSCDLEYKQRCMGPTEIEYEFHLWNGNEWGKEFSADEDALPVTAILLFCLQTLCLVAAYRVRVRLEAGGKKLHLTTRVLTEAVAFEWVALLLRMCFYLRYQGKGQAPLWLDTLSRVCHGVADVEIVILLVLLAKGWTIVRHKLRVASRMKLAAFAATYAMASFACLAWSQRVRNDVEVQFVYAGSTGIFLAVLRLVACAWFLKAMTDTIKHFPQKQAFCRVLRVLGAMWLLATPLVIFVAHMAEDPYRREIFEIGEATCFFLGQAGLVALYALGGKDTSKGWFQRDTERVRRPKRSDAIGAPPVRDSFDDKKVPGDFDILQSGTRRRLRVDDEFERNHIRKIGKVAKAITERVSKLREEAATFGDALAAAFVPAKFDQDLRVRTPPRRRPDDGDRWRARDDGEAPRPLQRSGSALDDALDEALPEYSSARRRLGSSSSFRSQKPAKIYT